MPLKAITVLDYIQIDPKDRMPIYTMEMQSIRMCWLQDDHYYIEFLHPQPDGPNVVEVSPDEYLWIMYNE